MAGSTIVCTIEDFWMPRLAGIAPSRSSSSLPGWSLNTTLDPSFVEAGLQLRPDSGHPGVPIWLVAAPGAVGKSTLAMEISARTGAVYLDLANADTVAGNYLTGGLVKNNILSQWQSDKTTILIDALDEARLRVTQKSFEDFLKDVAGTSRQPSFANHIVWASRDHRGDLADPVRTRAGMPRLRYRLF